MNDKQEQALLNEAKAAFEHSLSDIDGQTLSKIRQARHRALESHTRKSVSNWWVPTGVAVSACVAFVIFTLIPRVSDEPASLLEDIELITTSDDLELYEELEFYEWLEAYELPT